MPFAISSKYQNTHWTVLNLTDDRSLKWTVGIDIIKDRFESRFLKHINLIKDDEFSGFLIMSIDCLLIETLMQFYLGVDNTDINYSGNHWKSFKDFFKQSKHFNTDFKTNKLCRTFYQHFRCGLLHQAQTKQKSLIKICQANILTLVDTKDISKGLVIDRKQFHYKLELEFNDYLQKLSDNENNFEGQNLRDKAIEKMKIICAE